MDLSLRSDTTAALAQFRARRSSLLWRRGLLGSALSALGLLVLIALLDRLRLLPEGLRPWMSLAAYGVCVLVGWRIAWQYLSRVRDNAGAAREAECVAPELREKLLSAVELANVGDSELKDSPEFRATLQDEVARAVRGIDWKARQPAAVLVPWIKAVAAAVLVITVLSFVPRLHLHGFLARAALPFANLPRPSSVQIAIEQPAKSETLVPISSETEIMVRITGEPVAQAFLEYGEPRGPTSRMELSKLSAEQFQTRLPVGQNDLRFRVIASDGITAWRLLSARARPRITHFSKTILPPSYVGASPVTLNEDHGDLEVLEGTEVQLALTTNQPISEAGVVMNPEMSTRPSPPPVQVVNDTQLVTTLSIQPQTEAWTVKLKSSETGFTNDEAASWRITTIPDLPPVAQITEPAQAQLSLLPDESVRVTGIASDDVGLASVKLAHAINGSAWTESILATKPGKDSTVERLFLLAPLQVKAGDTLLLKLVAADVKGQTAESAPLRIIILEQTVDPARRAFSAEQRRLADMTKTLAEKSRELTKQASGLQKVAKDQKKGKQSSDDAESKLASFKQSLESTREQADDVWEQLKKTAQAATTPLDAQETKLLGGRLAKMRQDALEQMEQGTQEGLESPDLVKRFAGEAHGEAALAADAARAFAAESTAKLTAQTAHQMARQQNLLTETSLTGNRDPALRSKWQEQQRAALIAHEQVTTAFQELKEQVHGGHQNNLERMSKEVSEAANDLRESLDKAEDPQTEDAPQQKSPEHLYGASDNLRQRLQRSSEAIRGMADEAARRAQQLRESLANRDNPALASLEQAQLAMNEAALGAKDPKRAAKQKADKQGLMPAEKAQSELVKASKQLQDQAELRERNPLTNTEAALDANRVSRAAAKLSEMAAHAAKENDGLPLEQTGQKIAELAKVARTLDADALVQEAKVALNTAAQQSNGDAEQTATVAESAQHAADQLRQLPQAARRLQANEIATTAQQAADQARTAAQQLGDQARHAAHRRADEPAHPLPSPQALAEASMKTDQIALALAPQTETARQQLLAMAPKVSEMMNEVAKDLRDTQQKTETAQQQAAAEQPVSEVAESAKALQPDAADNAEKMDSLQAALRQEANAAQLDHADQRQLARTADVALESMRQQSPQIQAHLKQAQQAQQSQPQAQALQNAAQAQKQTADALQQLAQNLAKMENGEQVPQENLDQLAQMEQQLGVEQPLDEAYDKAQELAQAQQDAKSDPQKALAELEQQLAKSPAMQKALADIAKDTAQTAEKTLKEKANQPSMLGNVAEEAGHNLERVARHQQRLGKEQAAKEVAAVSKQLQSTANATKTQPANATPQVAEQSTKAAQAAAKSAEQTAAQTPSQPNLPAFEQTQATAMAQALDQLDAQLNAMQNGQPQQPSQDGKQSAQQQAQQSLSQAQAAQQQSMAQARAQGKVPGQAQSSQQTAQQNAKKGQQPSDSAQSSEDGGNYTTVMKDGQMVLVPVGAIDVADWGKLPSRMAEDLTEATRQEAAPEYRAAIEDYYKAIAAKAKR